VTRETRLLYTHTNPTPPPWFINSPMVKHALPARVRKQLQGKEKDRRLKDAITAYLKEQEKPEEGRKGGRAVAADFKIPHRTLMDHVKKVKNGQEPITIRSFNAGKQKIKPYEERVLVDFIKESADRGFPFNHRTIEAYANALLEAHRIRSAGMPEFNPKDFEPVGKQWVFNFLRRFHDKLASHWSKPLDMQRARSLNPEAVKGWYQLVEKFIVELGITPDLIFGMDESGFPPANQGMERVVGSRGTRTQHKQGGADRENVTAIVTICADGTRLHPMIIYKGRNMMAKWCQDNVANAM
jgi:hypothetical protein